MAAKPDETVAGVATLDPEGAAASITGDASSDAVRDTSEDNTEDTDSIGTVYQEIDDEHALDTTALSVAIKIEDLYTNERVNYLRYTGAIIIDGPSMYKSFFQAYLPLKMKKDWGEGQLWKTWCVENYDAAIRSFQFFNKLIISGKTDLIGDRSIPIFEKCDVSFFAHVVDKRVKRDHVRSASDLLRKIRNDHVHDDGSGLSDAECYEHFEFLKKKIIEKMFKDFPELRVQWLIRMDRVKLGDFDEKLKKKTVKARIQIEDVKKDVKIIFKKLEGVFLCLSDDEDDDDDLKFLSSAKSNRTKDQLSSRTTVKKELPTTVKKELPTSTPSPETSGAMHQSSASTEQSSNRQLSEDERFQLPQPWTSPPITDSDSTPLLPTAPPPPSPRLQPPSAPTSQPQETPQEPLSIKQIEETSESQIQAGDFLQSSSGPPEINNDNNNDNNPIFSERVILSLPPQLISAPPILESLWPTAERFFIGAGFVAAEVDGRILIWGGGQKQPDNKRGEVRLLPNDVVFILKVDSLSWEKIKATGDVPPCTADFAFAVLNKLTYIFGGGIGSNKETNKIHSLTLSGEFKRLIPTGDAPSPRRQHSGWSFEEKIYFFGGIGPKGEGRRWIESKNLPGKFYNNQLIEFDPKHNSFSQVITNGRSPSPRINFAVAQLEEKVFIHGKWCSRRFDDFHLLNMKSKSWSSLRFDLPTGIRVHTLSPISSTQLLLVGGKTLFGPSKKLYVVDVEDSRSSFVENLPSEFCGEEEGLCAHRAIVVTKDKKAKSLICIGGWIDKNWEKHPNHIIKFDLL